MLTECFLPRVELPAWLTFALRLTQDYQSAQAELPQLTVYAPDRMEHENYLTHFNSSKKIFNAIKITKVSYIVI